MDTRTAASARARGGVVFGLLSTIKPTRGPDTTTTPPRVCYRAGDDAPCVVKRR
jgi:hypothetical protein